MLCLVCESKEATSRIAEVLELMSAHAHKQVFQSSVSSFLRLKYVGKLKTPFVYSNISVSYTCFSIVCVFVFAFHVRRKAQKPFVFSNISVSYACCFSIVYVFVFTFHVRRKAQNAIRLLKHQCFLYMSVVPQTGGHEFYLATPSSRETLGSQSAPLGLGNSWHPDVAPSSDDHQLTSFDGLTPVNLSLTSSLDIYNYSIDCPIYLVSNTSMFLSWLRMGYHISHPYCRVGRTFELCRILTSC